MKVASHKTFLIELTEHDAWMLEQVLGTAKSGMDKDSDHEKPFLEFTGNLLTNLTKEMARKI